MELIKKLIGATPEEIPVRYQNGILSQRDNVRIMEIIGTTGITELDDTKKQEILDILGASITRVILADPYDFSVSTGIGRYEVEFCFGCNTSDNGHGYQKMSFLVSAVDSETAGIFCVNYDEMTGNASIEKEMNGLNDDQIMEALLQIAAHGEWRYTEEAEIDSNRDEAIGFIKTQFHRVGYFIEDLPATVKAIGAVAIPLILIAIHPRRK